MTLTIWISFAIACIVIQMIPGPTVLTVVAWSLAHGRRLALPLAIAVAAGDATALLLSLFGLGLLLEASATAFLVVKVLGAAYLIWLGIDMMRRGIAAQLPKTESAPLQRMVFHTWLVTALNPKGITFFLAFMPQFVNPNAPAAPQLTLLGATFVVLAALNAAGYALLAAHARRWLNRPSTTRPLALGGGGLLCGAGLWTLLSR
ncbi:MAG: LysE family translocator [Pseudomonadota bacterium]